MWMCRVTDLKDRSLAEHNFERVNFMSILYLVVLTAAGLAQVQTIVPSMLRTNEKKVLGLRLL